MRVEWERERAGERKGWGEREREGGKERSECLRRKRRGVIYNNYDFLVHTYIYFSLCCFRCP